METERRVAWRGSLGVIASFDEAPQLRRTGQKARALQHGNWNARFGVSRPGFTRRGA